MNAGKQTRTGSQLDLFGPWTPGRQEAEAGGDGIAPRSDEARQAFTAAAPGRALATDLMERVADLGNLRRAMRVVRRNKGSGGIDGMTVGELEPWLAAHGQALQQSLLSGSYQPGPVRGGKSPSPAAGCVNWASRRWWTGSCSRR
jgi:hypothetical protein